MIDSYFISYFSNQSSDYFTQNKSYKFKVYLPHQTFFPSELTQKKLIVGLKSLTFQFAKNVTIPNIIGLKSSLIDQSNKAKDQIFFMTQVKTEAEVQHFSISHPLYFLTNRRKVASPTFEFTTYNARSDKFETLDPNILREDITVHVQVEIKAIDKSMDLQHFNVLVTSSDKESSNTFPTNKPYNFTIVKKLEFPENEKWIMGLKSLIIPSLMQNAEVPDFGINYTLEMIPKNREKHLPYKESFFGDLPQKHFENKQEFFQSLSEQWNKISKIKNFFTFDENGLKIKDAKVLVYKSSLLERPPPPPPTPTPTPTPPPPPAPAIEEIQVENPNLQDPDDLLEAEEEVEEFLDDKIHLFKPLPDEEGNDNMEVTEVEDTQKKKRKYDNDDDESNVDETKYIRIEGDETVTPTNPMEVVDEPDTRIRNDPCLPRKRRKKPGQRGYNKEIEDKKDAIRKEKCERKKAREARGAEGGVDDDDDYDDDDDDDDDDDESNLEKENIDSTEAVVEEEEDQNSIEFTVDEDVIMEDRTTNMFEDYLMAAIILQTDLSDSTTFPQTLFNMEHRVQEDSESPQEYENFKMEEETKLAQRISTHTFKLYFEITKSLAKMFGIDDSNRIVDLSDEDLWRDHTKTFCTPTLSTNLNFAVPQTILLNCDLVEESLVGNQKLPLLKHIFLGEKVFERDKQYHFEFNIDQWHVVKMKNISKFNLSVTDLLGNQLSLQESQHNLPTIVELIFKRVNHDYNY